MDLISQRGGTDFKGSGWNDFAKSFLQVRVHLLAIEENYSDIEECPFQPKRVELNMPE